MRLSSSRLPAAISGLCLATAVVTATPQIRVSELTAARGVEAGRPVAPASVLPPDAGEVFVWGRIDGVTESTPIVGEWFFLGGAAPLAIGQAVVTATPSATTVQFSLALAEGRRWPAGPYRVQLRVGGAVIAECRFAIATPEARYVHPRVGYGFALPTGWSLDDSGAEDGVRLRAPDGEGLIEIQTGPTSVRLDAVSYAAGWQSVAVGPGKRVEALRGSRRIVVDGLPAFEGVYSGPGVLVKMVFVATADRMYVITGAFEASQFSRGETLFDAWMASVRVSPPSN